MTTRYSGAKQACADLREGLSQLPGLPARGVIARTEGPTAEKVPPTYQLGDALRDSVFHNSDRFRKARA